MFCNSRENKGFGIGDTYWLMRYANAYIDIGTCCCWRASMTERISWLATWVHLTDRCPAHGWFSRGCWTNDRRLGSNRRRRGDRGCDDGVPGIGGPQTGDGSGEAGSWSRRWLVDRHGSGDVRLLWIWQVVVRLRRDLEHRIWPVVIADIIVLMSPEMLAAFSLNHFILSAND